MKSVRELADLHSRVVLITGGGGHIGSAMADALAEQGADVALLDVSAVRAGQVAENLKARHGVNASAWKVDLEREMEVRRVAAQAVEHHGRMDTFIHCAALGGTSPLKGWVTPFEEQSMETWRKALEVNLNAAFILSQACAPALRSKGKGSIILVGSIYGMLGPDLRLYEGTPMGNPAAYAASKGGLLQLSRWLATALAPSIRVNMISFGGIERGQPETFQTRYIDHTPMKRMGTEEDAKGAAVFLASDLSAYVTGQNIVVDGGWSAW